MFRYGAIALRKVHLYAILLLVLKYFGYRHRNKTQARGVLTVLQAVVLPYVATR